MIVVPIQLWSAINGRIENLGTLVIDNIGGSASRGNYQARMYRKGALEKHSGNAFRMLRDEKPFRSGQVTDHPRLAEPVHNLVLKALKAMGYKGDF